MAANTSVPVKAPETKPARRAMFDVVDDMVDAFQEMARLWGRGWPIIRPVRRPALGGLAWAPRMDVFEKDGSIVVKAELPGVKKEDVQVSLDRGDLEIQGERREESEVKEDDYYRCERSYGSFYRRLPLGFEIKPEQIQAHFADGVLEVRIPKPAEAKSEAQKIKIA